MKTPAVARRPAMNSGALCLGVLATALFVVTVAAYQDSPNALDEVLALLGGRNELRSHVEFGNLFIVEVLSVLEEKNEKWSAQDVDNRVISYRALVEKTLRGTAEGEITIQYVGADVMSPDTMGFGALNIGKRYLLSAGSLTVEGAYPVYAGMGTILLEDQKTEEALVAEVERLIPIVDKKQRQAILELTAEAAKARDKD